MADKTKQTEEEEDDVPRTGTEIEWRSAEKRKAGEEQKEEKEKEEDEDDDPPRG